jgi:serine/threonine protein kinase
MPPAPSASQLLEPPIPRLEYEAGTVIAHRYRLVEPIGFGGMGTVWRAHNEVLDAPLALKVLCSNIRGSGSPERLLLEAKAAACLRHPAIVRVFDFGMTERGDAFLAMELLEGESLGDVLEREQTMPAARAVGMLLPILAGLTCAHARGIVHRDLKPDNIFLARDDAGCVEPKVVDFGIAKFERSPSHITSVGVLLGSPSYMSPEQALGEEDIDMRADVWAIAVVLYEAIAGRQPWEAPSCPALLRAIVDDPPSPLLGIGGVDAELWAVIERGLAKRRQDRWSSSRDFGRALAVWLDKSGVVDDLSGTSLKTAWLTDEESPTGRASLESFPPIFTNPTVQKLGGTTGRTQTEALRKSAARSGKRRGWLTLGIGIPLAASLLLFQVGFRTSRPPTTPALAVATAPSQASQASQPSQSDAEIEAMSEAPTPTTVTNVIAPFRARTTERHSNIHPAPAPSTSASVPIVNAPSPRPGSARAMDFGF